ncbi:hypothetical protein Sa4125_11200 [Aureimonas sp. SA4125]|nr:hypothetical protein Sa4125_11200 [Aureimonas sp. SA4125]
MGNLPEGRPDTEHLSRWNVQDDDLAAIGRQPDKANAAGQEEMELPNRLSFVEDDSAAAQASHLGQVQSGSGRVRQRGGN